MKKWTVGLAALLALSAGSALAVKKGEALYVKTKDAKLLEKADAKAKSVLVMQPGKQVTWNGADKANKQFHSVTFDGKAGFTLQQNLTPNAPGQEIVKSDGKAIDQEAFKSSGAATKALSEAAIKYSGEKPDLLALTKGVLSAEGVAQKVELSAAEQYVVKQTGGGK